MKLDNESFAYNCAGCPSWGTAIVVQTETNPIKEELAKDILYGIVHNMIPIATEDFKVAIGKGAHWYNGKDGFDDATSEPIIAGLFKHVEINGIPTRYPFILYITKDHTAGHDGRLQVKYTPKVQYGTYDNQLFFDDVHNILNIPSDSYWNINELYVKDQEILCLNCVNSQNTKIIPPIEFPTTEHLQQIYYGAPGTGKSFGIESLIAKYHIGDETNVFRTTFHPDSDYSTFVGCYKPTMALRERIYNQGELISKLTEIKKSGVTYPVHKFSAIYWESLNQLTSDDIKAILSACEFTESMNVEVSKGIAIGQELSKNCENKKIAYTFVPQTFTKAYIKAYQAPEEPVILVIEEINRGNCAQIFGDLFQLLDRKNGVSEYPIDADEDLRKYLIDTLGEDSPAIANGKLCLPSNLYIWVTMNTSDQSLFPIDSAFKRRWEWKYTRIAQGKKEDGTLEHWKLENDTDWWDFLKKINAIIDDMTQSADKQLGYYFCKPDKENDTISYARFVNKVLFYLWNDIFKTFSTDEYEQLFKIKCLKTDADGKWIEPHELEDKESKLTFPEFYDEKGDVIPEIAKQFIEKVIAWGGKPAAENA